MDLASAVDELKEMTTQPMVPMFDKQPKEGAVQKRSERKRMVTKEVPQPILGYTKRSESNEREYYSL